MLVVDISHASRSIGRGRHGMVGFDPSVRIVGVILNKAGSHRHADEVCRALEPTGPVLGVLHRDDGIVAPSRHLGLVPAQERDEAAHALDRLTDRLAERVDLERVLELARTAPDLDAEPWDPRLEVTPTSAAPTRRRGGRRPRVHVPLRRDRGAARVPPAATSSSSTRSPTRPCPPDTAGIYLGGGFPEVHAAGLSANDRTPRRPARGDRGRHPHRRRVRRPAVPLQHRRRRPDGGHVWTHGRRCPRG